ncbi:hypothetical protein DITRI_Ditri12bG0082100 [Diplodiscus trichospermus]
MRLSADITPHCAFDTDSPHSQGTQFADDQGIYNGLTWWEQIENGKQLTRNRKFLTVVPVVLNEHKRMPTRAKRKWESRNGSKSTPRYQIAGGGTLDSPTGQIETWRLRHWHPKHGWSSPDLQVKYEEMMQLRRDNPPEILSDKEILEKVLGRRFV